MTGHPPSYPVPIDQKGDTHPVDIPEITLRIGDGAGFDSALPAFPYGELMHGRQSATLSPMLEARLYRSERTTTDLPSKAWLHTPGHVFHPAAAFEATEPVVHAPRASPEVVV